MKEIKKPAVYSIREGLFFGPFVSIQGQVTNDWLIVTLIGNINNVEF